MIKTASGNMAILGLSHENLSRLKEGEPIKLNLKDVGLHDVEILIFSGETEESMKAQLMPATRKAH